MDVQAESISYRGFTHPAILGRLRPFMPSARRHARTYSFSNKFCLIHEPLNSSPTVAYHLSVGVGSALESPTTAGVSHFIEHMLFKGIPSNEGTSFSEQVEDLGGVMNAFTSFEETSFQLVISRRHWEEGLRLFLEMILKFRPDEDELEVERKVILEELAEGNDILDTQLSEKLWANMYPGHGYGRPVIGTEETLKRLDLGALKDHYRRWYRPSNIVLVVAGNVDWQPLADVVGELVEPLDDDADALPTRAGAPISPAMPVTLLQKGEHERIIELAVHIPGARHPDLPAIDLLSLVLGEGEMSRLYRHIRFDLDAVRSIGTNLFPLIESGLFLVRALPNTGDGLDVIREASGEIRKLRTEGITSRELARAKRLLEKEFVFNDETPEGRARTLAYFHAVYGSIEKEAEYRERALAVTEDELQEVAQRILDPKNWGAAILLPGGQALPSADDVRKALADPAGPAPAKAPARTFPGPVQRWTLENGLRVVFRRVPGVPISSCYALSLGGLRSEDTDVNGISSLMSAVMERGTDSRTEEDVSEECTFLQAEISGFVGQNVQGLRMEGVRDNFLQAFALFSDLLFRPRFDESAVDQERSALLRELESQTDYFETTAANLFAETLFGSHPYRLNLLGTPASLKKLDADQLLKRHLAATRTDRLVLAIVGDHDEEELRSRVEDLFNVDPVHDGPLPLLGLAPDLLELREVRRPINGEKTYVCYGFLGPSRASEDRYAVDILCTLLASSGAGRLFTRLRDELGLVYTVDTNVFYGIDTGCIAVTYNCTPDCAESAYEETRKEFESLRTEDVPASELQRVKNFLIGTYEMELERTISQAALLCAGELHGSEKDVHEYPEAIAKITAADVRKAAERYLTPDRGALVWLSPAVN